jgi:hypothetical protein
VEVPAQEAEQAAGDDEAQDRDERLVDLPAQAEHPEGDGGDEGDPGRKAIEPIDEVEAVDHPDDPDDREPGAQQRREQDVAGPERVTDLGDRDAERDGDHGQTELAEELPPSSQVEAVVEGSEHGREQPTNEQPDQVRARNRSRGRLARKDAPHRDEPAPDEEEGDDHGDPAATRQRTDMDAALVRLVDDAQAADDAPHDGGREQGHDRRG